MVERVGLLGRDRGGGTDLLRFCVDSSGLRRRMMKKTTTMKKYSSSVFFFLLICFWIISHFKEVQFRSDNTDKSEGAVILKLF